jgi:hypothetical protein
MMSAASGIPVMSSMMMMRLTTSLHRRRPPDRSQEAVCEGGGNWDHGCRRS